MSAPFLPFLYQTRTLQRLPRARTLRAAFLHRTVPRRRHDEDIPFDLPPEIQKQREREAQQETPRGRSTITPSERSTFDRIFEEIAARGRTSAASSLATESTEILSSLGQLQRERGAGPHERPEFTTKGRDSINVVMEDAARRSPSARRLLGRTDASRLGPPDAAPSADERERALLSFPPSLRRAARLALGVIEPGEAAGLDPKEADWEGMDEADGLARMAPVHGSDALDRSIELETQRAPERVRVERLMRDAPTDLALWQVMEAEVFSMVEKLGLGESKPKESKAKAKRGRRKTAVEEEGPRLNMDVHGPLYPSYLLHGLRLLDTNFSGSSPLALSLLPRIKQGGLMSYVLGVSTPFYNSLMSVYWHRYNDVHAVFGLLDEMSHAGLYFDEASRAIVDSIEYQMTPRVGGSSGPFLKEVLNMPEYETVWTTRLKHWKRAIQTSMEERKKDLGY